MRAYSRTATLGSVDYRGQRAIIVKALTASNSEVPQKFGVEHVVAAIDQVEYEIHFKHRKMVVTIHESVRFHLKELTKLGQLKQISQDNRMKEPTPVQTTAARTIAPLELLKEWSEWTPTNLPFVLNGDKEILQRERIAGGGMVSFGSWSDAISAQDFGRSGDSRLHVGLLPQPFLGNLKRASIYILSLNPGLAPSDYYGEYEVPGFRVKLLANLKQTLDQSALPFLFLDPHYSWHGGFRWWNGKLSGVISQLSDVWGLSFSAARARVAQELASIELMPYHSSIFRYSDRSLQDLRSVQLAKAFVTQFVLPRVKRSEAIVIVLRKKRYWGLPEIDGVTQYGETEARGAHLSPNSRGGRAILERLMR